MTKSRQRYPKKHVLLFVVVVYIFVAVDSQWVPLCLAIEIKWLGKEPASCRYDGYGIAAQ